MTEIKEVNVQHSTSNAQRSTVGSAVSAVRPDCDGCWMLDAWMLVVSGSSSGLIGILDAGCWMLDAGSAAFFATPAFSWMATYLRNTRLRMFDPSLYGRPYPSRTTSILYRAFSIHSNTGIRGPDSSVFPCRFSEQFFRPSKEPTAAQERPLPLSAWLAREIKSSAAAFLFMARALQNQTSVP